MLLLIRKFRTYCTFKNKVKSAAASSSMSLCDIVFGLVEFAY